MIRIVIQDLIDKSFEGAGIDPVQHTKWTVIQFVGRDVAREVTQRLIEVVSVDVLGRFFPLASTQFWTAP